MINIIDLCVNYKDSRALDGVSTTINKSDLIAVVGANGAGKSTLLKSIMGQLKPSSGRIDLGQLTPKDIAYLPQSHQIDRKFPITVREFVSAGAWRRTGFWHMFSRSEKVSLEQALNKVNLAGVEERQISALSGGQFQRMLFARMLMQDAEILLLDEPFAAIDAQTTMDLMDVIHDCQKQGKTIITVIHDLGLVNRFFPKVILLAKHLIGSGETESIMTGENLSRAGYQHIAYIPEPAPSITKIETVIEPSAQLPIKQPVNPTAVCSNPAHYEENAS
ncbi:metal ABC transporter ATP-binding protein [Psychromonas sp. PT13]|uniref:metal ABC transporter ATP-binding protein n=1 Tax=Psychromonas sp. PT13 TaxID=3439547 RepID=UPI003EBA227F